MDSLPSVKAFRWCGDERAGHRPQDVQPEKSSSWEAAVCPDGG